MDTSNAAQTANESTWLDHAVRIGLVMYGVVHLLIGWLAIQLALGEKSGKASSSGALHELAQQPFGRVMVWLVAIGMVFLVIWRLLEAVVGSPGEDDDAKDRLISLAKAVVYGVLGVSAFKVAVGDGSSGGKESMTAKVMDWPAGQWFVALAGVGVIAYGISQVIRGWTEKFTEHLDVHGTTGKDGRAFVLFGKLGYIAKGISIGIVGGLFTYAGATHKAGESGGLDKALQTVLQQPLGPVLLFAIGVGIACYGLFCFARARHLAR